VGILRDSGSTNFNLPAVGRTGPRLDALLEAVREEARGEYEVFGEITRGADGSVVYLARDVEDAQLVILKLTSSGGGDYFLEVVKELDTSVAAPEGVCSSCQSPLRQWGRYCPRCGSDLWGDPSISGEWSRQELLQAVKEMAADRYEIYGEIPRAEGAGFVYFGRDLETGKLAALRLLKESADAFSLGQTGLLRRIAKPDLPKTEPQEPPRQPLPAEPLPPEPLLPDVLGGAPPPTAPRTPRTPPPTTPPPTSVYQGRWAQAIDFLKQPVVIAILAITLVVATVTLCTIAMTGDASRPPPDEPVAETPEAAPPAVLQEEVLAYSVVVGSYGTLEEARERQRQLSSLGPILYIAPTVVRGSLYYRLYAAMLPDREQAQALQSRLVHRAHLLRRILRCPARCRRHDRAAAAGGDTGLPRARRHERRQLRLSRLRRRLRERRRGGTPAGIDGPGQPGHRAGGTRRLAGALSRHT
jgi:hypothetical protein